MLIGLTGPSGAGKSTVAALFRGAGYRIIDSDGLVHTLYESPHCAEKIAAVFGADYLSGGAVDRKKLGALVFSDKNALARLNRTVAPLILEAVMEQVEAVRTSGVDAVLDAPLLFEYQLEAVCDVTLGVIADTEAAVRRLAARDGRTETEIRARLAAQHDDAFFREHCDFILENNGDHEHLIRAFDAQLKELHS